MKAARSFKTIDDVQVSEGDQGGAVSGDFPNLFHWGCSWITAQAKAIDQATVYGNALVTGKAHLGHFAEVYDNAQVSNALVLGHADIYGNAKVYGGKIAGDARIYGDAWVTGGEILGEAHVYGDAKVSGGKIEGSAHIGATVEGRGYFDGRPEVSGGHIGGLVKVGGNAKVVAGMVLKGSEVLDGVREHEEAAKYAYRGAYREVYWRIIDLCAPDQTSVSSGEDDWHELTVKVLAPPRIRPRAWNDQLRQWFNGDLALCRLFTEKRRLAAALKPGFWDILLLGLGNFSNALKVGTFVRVVLESASHLKTLKDLKKVAEENLKRDIDDDDLKNEVIDLPEESGDALVDLTLTKLQLTDM